MLLRSARVTALASVRRLSTLAAGIVENEGGGTSFDVKEGVGGDTLGRRLLSLVYPKRSAVVAIRKWQEEGHTVRKYEINRIVRELRKFRRYKHALEICEWMKLQEDIKLQPGDYAVHLDLIAKIRGLNSAEKFFEDIPDQMRGHAVCTSLLHTYTQSKLSDKAEALFDKMSECGFLTSPLPYNHMLSMYISKGQLEKAPIVIQELKKKTTPDIFTYNIWLTAVASANDVEAAEKVYLELKQTKIHPDWVTLSVLTNLYIKTGDLDKAKVSLKEMEKLVSKKKRLSYASLISLHGSIGDKDGLNQIWERMRSYFRKMNDAEYFSMISSLVKLRQFTEAKDLYNEWESVSGTRDAKIPNVILTEHMNRGEMHLVEKFFQQMVEKGITPNYSTYEILTRAYLKDRHIDKVVECFKNAVGSIKKWTPNVRLIGEIYREIEEQGNVERAEELLSIIREAGHMNTQLYNCLLRTYSKAGKMALIIEERMAKDNVELDEECRELIRLTSTMSV